MQIDIVVSPENARRWQKRLRDRLRRLLPKARISLRYDQSPAVYPAAVELLLQIERWQGGAAGGDLCDRDSEREAQPDGDGPPDVLIDLTSASTTDLSLRASRVLRPLYNGAASELTAIAALLDGAKPRIAIEDVARGAIVAEGLPSLEAAQGLRGGLEALFSRAITLIEHVLLSPERIQPGSAASAVARPGAGDVARFLTKSLARSAARRLYHLLCHSPHWHVGWRFLDGPGVFETGTLAGAPWNRLAVGAAGFAADPFPVEWQGEHYIFFERLDYRTDKGAIFAQRVGPSGPMGDPVPALEEPWHLSYPFIFVHDDKLRMIPEASASRAVSLYTCVEFPSKWRCEGHLIAGVEAADATLFPHENRWWMTSVVRDGVGGYSDTLAIHHAEALMGPWIEHAQRPVLVDSRMARPAGRVVRREGALWRPVQDCSVGYGKSLILARIDALDADRFAQTEMNHISPGPDWPGTRLHTLNRWGRLECIDGAQARPKSAMLAKLI